MWYVVQVRAGQERKVCDQIERALEGVCDEDGRLVLKECFVPRFQVERKFHGVFRKVERVLFPGYVIAVTSRVELLNRYLYEVPTLTRILGTEESFVPLDRSEAAFINAFTMEKRRVMRLSVAVKEGDAVKVLEGPLVGREGWITQVNRRKGTARIETEAFGRKLSVEVGIAVLGKRASGCVEV